MTCVGPGLSTGGKPGDRLCRWTRCVRGTCGTLCLLLVRLSGVATCGTGCQLALFVPGGRGVGRRGGRGWWCHRLVTTTHTWRQLFQHGGCQTCLSKLQKEVDGAKSSPKTSNRKWIPGGWWCDAVACFLSMKPDGDSASLSWYHPCAIRLILCNWLMKWCTGKP